MTFVWTDWFPARARWIAWGVLTIIWLLAWFEAQADWRRLLAEWSAGETGPVDPAAVSDQLFRGAQAAYLAGDWVSAEQGLIELVRRDPRDAEARLLLATLWRHEGRLEAAQMELERLSRLDGAAIWEQEIACECERIRTASVENMRVESRICENNSDTIINTDSDASLPQQRMAA